MSAEPHGLVSLRCRLTHSKVVKTPQVEVLEAEADLYRASVHLGVQLGYVVGALEERRPVGALHGKHQEDRMEGAKARIGLQHAFFVEDHIRRDLVVQELRWGELV